MKLSRHVTPMLLFAVLLSLPAPAQNEIQQAQSSVFLHRTGKHSVKSVRSAMGSVFEITAVHEDEAVARAAMEQAYAEIERIEALISSWRPDSQTGAVNRAAGDHPVQVGPELFGLTHRALKISRLTNGAFDITIDAVIRIWDFSKGESPVPDPAILAEKRALVDYKSVQLSQTEQTIFLKKPGMRMGFGAIGKGFAANRAAAVMREAGVRGGVVNAGGDLFVFGLDGEGQPWRVSIAHPRDKSRRIADLELTDQAVVTSGDYERFFIHDGVRYSHIIDPRTGFPVRELTSVTIICPDAEAADALATSVFVLGISEGLSLINRLKGFSAILIDVDGKVHLSQDLAERVKEVH